MRKKYTVKDVEKDLLSKLLGGYFRGKLFKNEKNKFRRRSFKDLFTYYRKYSVTEKILMKALINTGFSAKLCTKAGAYVFFKYYDRDEFIFSTNDNGPDSSYYDGYLITNSKYNKKYLTKLYKSVI